MSTPCSEYEPLIAEALFGELSPEERHRLDRHLERCDACAEELRTMQATLEITARRERPEPPPSFWQGYWPRLVRRMEREATLHSPSLTERIAAWWRGLTALPPAARWALQGAVAVALVVGGFWLGRQQAAAPTDDLLLGTEEPAGALSGLLPAGQSVDAEPASAPRLANIRDITYDVRDGTVAIRYNAVTDVVVRGTPDDPAIQQLLQTAMLDDRNPSARLNALQAVEKSRPAADADLVEALTYLAKDEANPNMRFRAVRALRALHQEAPLPEEARAVLINILLNEPNSALRIEALQALMTGASSTDEGVPEYLYAARNDSNSYVRHQVRQALQAIDNRTPSSNPF